MRLSRFVLTYKDVRPGEHVLYDVIGDHYVGVDDATLAAVGRWGEDAPLGADERQVQEALKQNGFLVVGGEEDDERLRVFLEAAKEGMPGTMYVTLMPTLKCNLACNYCFQKEHPAFNRMHAETEAATVEWVLRKVDEAASRRLLVHFFGGEPLTRKDFLLRTAEIFHASMAARGAEFEWEITTNGVGLDVEFVRSMRAFGAGAIKVTIDGDKETHDAARVYRDGRGTFDEIFANTVRVARECPDVRLRVGGNFQPKDVGSYERLLDRFEGLGLQGAFDLVRFKPVVETARKECSTCTSCASAQGEVDATMQLADSVERRGLSRTSTSAGLPGGPCELHWKNSYIIDPDGRVYKCPAVAGRPELAVASTVGPSVEKVAPLLELRPWEKCGDCPYLPVCVGGCLGGKYLATGRRDEVFCRRDYFERAFQADVTARYLAEFGAEEEAAGAA
jgi:uncharacterized protein